MPTLTARVNPVYPDGPPTPLPARQLEVLARLRFNIDDIMEDGVWDWYKLLDVVVCVRWYLVSRVLGNMLSTESSIRTLASIHYNRIRGV